VAWEGPTENICVNTYLKLIRKQDVHICGKSILGKENKCKVPGMVVCISLLRLEWLKQQKKFSHASAGWKSKI
jgi:hypothetical protein